MIVTVTDIQLVKCLANIQIVEMVDIKQQRKTVELFDLINCTYYF